MKHLEALAVKFCITAVIFSVTLLGLTALNFSRVLIVSLCFAVPAYLVCDLLILPRAGNTIATVTEIAFAAVLLYLFRFVYPGASITLTAVLIAAALVGLVGWIFHRYVLHILGRSGQERHMPM